MDSFLTNPNLFAVACYRHNSHYSLIKATEEPAPFVLISGLSVSRTSHSLSGLFCFPLHSLRIDLTCINSIFGLLLWRKNPKNSPKTTSTHPMVPGLEWVSEQQLSLHPPRRDPSQPTAQTPWESFVTAWESLWIEFGCLGKNLNPSRWENLCSPPVWALCMWKTGISWTGLMVSSPANPSCEGCFVEDARICASQEPGTACWLRVLSHWDPTGNSSFPEEGAQNVTTLLPSSSLAPMCFTQPKGTKPWHSKTDE